VTGNPYRNPELLADMARTVDHISGGRAYLGIGAGWFEKDFDEYGYDFGTKGSRLRDLEASLVRIRERIPKLNPAPIGRLPVLVAGGGEKVTLRLVAQHADAWNTFGPPESYAAKNAILDEWCAEVGRDPAEIERTVDIGGDDIDRLPELLDAGATHIILGLGAPFALDDVQRLLQAARG
jgi:alkanesulfonate monooxygenase SsuD/methylene tetrahydromethanopterin reductase-like flavin-dependent oxidoreductase (luciferase family)